LNWDIRLFLLFFLLVIVEKVHQLDLFGLLLFVQRTIHVFGQAWDAGVDGVGLLSDIVHVGLLFVIVNVEKISLGLLCFFWRLFLRLIPDQGLIYCHDLECFKVSMRLVIPHTLKRMVKNISRLLIPRWTVTTVHRTNVFLSHLISHVTETVEHFVHFLWLLLLNIIVRHWFLSLFMSLVIFLINHAQELLKLVGLRLIRR
jgi:hypothetical protein